MKITSRFAFKKGVFYWTSKSAISVEKGVFSRPESANMGCFLSLGTSIVYVLVGVDRGVVEWRALADSHHYIHTPGKWGRRGVNNKQPGRRWACRSTLSAPLV